MRSMPPIPGYSESYENTNNISSHSTPNYSLGDAASSGADRLNSLNSLNPFSSLGGPNVGTGNLPVAGSASASAVPSRRSSPRPVVSERNLKGLISPAQNVAHMICKVRTSTSLCILI